MRKIFVFTLAIFSLLFGESTDYNQTQALENLNKQYEAQNELNEDNQKKYEAQKNYLDLSSKGWKIRSTLKDDRHIQEELNELTLLKTNQKTQIKPMVNMDSLYIHTMYPLIILLPDGANITNAYCYPATARPNYQYNRLDILPSDDLLQTTLMITYIQNNSVKTMNILLTKIPNNKKNVLQREIKYVEEPYLSAEEVLTRYFDAHKKYPKANAMIQIGRNNYQFIKDNINGSITLDGVEGRFLMRVNGN